MIRFLRHIILPFLFFSILGLTSGLGQVVPVFVPNQSVCQGDVVEYTAYGFVDSPKMFMDIFDVDGNPLLDADNNPIQYEMVSQGTVTFDSGNYQKFTFSKEWTALGVFKLRIREKSITDCEGGNTNELTVTVNGLPGDASDITGDAIVQSGQTGVIYRIPTVANATSYEWVYSGTGANITNNGDEITVNFAADATSGELKVRGISACGNGEYSNLFSIYVVSPCETTIENWTFNEPVLTQDWKVYSTVNGWSSTPHGIEIWRSGFLGVDTPDGGQFCELNSNGANTMFQDIDVNPGAEMVWAVTYRYRNSSSEKVMLQIGPDATSLVDVALIQNNHGDAWVVHSGSYTVPSSLPGGKVRFQIKTVSPSSSSGNLIDGIQFYSVNSDVEPPQFIKATLPANTIDLGGACEFTLPDYTVGVDAIDNCDADLVITQNPAAGEKVFGGEKVVLTATDEAGNEATYEMEVLGDNVAPTASNPAPITVQCISKVPTQDITVVADEADNCTVTPTVAWVSDSDNGGLGTTASPYVVTRTYSVTDDASNSINVTQTITAIDDIKPTILGGPTEDIIVGACSNTVTWPVVTATDNCSATLTSTHDSGDVFPVGTTSVTFTATDAVGNTTTFSFNVTVLNAVTISLVETNPILCNKGSADVTITAGGGDGSYTYSKDGTNYQGTNVFELTAGMHTLYVKDGKGCIAQDNITINEPAPINLSLISKTDVDCSGAATGAIDINVTGGEANALNFDGTTGGVQINSWSPLYNASEFTVEGWVKLKSGNNYTSGQYSFFGQNNTVEFGIDGGNLHGWIHTRFGQNYSINYPVVNNLDDGEFHHVAFSGDRSQLVLYIDGVEVENLSISIPISDYFGGDPSDYLRIGTGVFDGSNNDPFDGEISHVRFWNTSRSQSQIFNGMTQIMDGNESGLLGAYPLNEGSGTTISGVGSFAHDGNIASGVSWTADAPIYQYSWTKQGDASFTATTQDLSDVTAGSYDVTVTTTDGCTTSGTYTIGTDVDTEDPIILGCPSDKIVGACNNNINWVAPTATDNCTVTLTSTHNPGDIFPVGTTPVTYTATDGSGNTANCSFNVTVLPAVTISLSETNSILCNGGNADITITAGGGDGAYTYSKDGTNYQGSNVFSLRSGTHTLYVKDGDGCVAQTNITINEPTVLDVNIAADNNTICEGEPVVVTATVSGGVAAYTYEFYLNGTQLTSDANYTISGNQLTSSAFANGDEITVKVIDNNSCEKTSDKVIMVVNELPNTSEILHN
ncbi:HYR domain-containing protein [Marinifilum flexuosum]|uniref:HYR domain-containing protein n=1 Tax=Marinifilum flexuosum TaxID=1117708 RepID=UPI0024903A6E|nr:HYR domain-containing protein [Marinifilum flexuosum]